MAGVQLGDCVALGKFAWDVWRCGFGEEANASRHYAEFGRDIKSLASNLRQLEDIVNQANVSIQRQSGRPLRARWDLSSVKEIIGDYESTLQECRQLIRDNIRYARGTGVARNLQWHALVQPTADRLRGRIMLHNSKISYLLQPFQTDLLRRIEQDIQHMHADLIDRITAVQSDIRRLTDPMLPNGQAIEHPIEVAVQLWDVPSVLSDRFARSALADRPESLTVANLKLEDLSDALMFNFRAFQKATDELDTSDSSISSEMKYLALMKCVWLFSTMRDILKTSSTGVDSHWPSYLSQFEEDLGMQCRDIELHISPEEALALIDLEGDSFSLWPHIEETLLSDIVSMDEEMEELFDGPLMAPIRNTQRHVKLLKRFNSSDRPFRVVVSASRTESNARQKPETAIIDFDTTSTILNPQYALPTDSGNKQEILVQRDDRIANLEFTSLKDALKFQQAITGFKSWDYFCEYNVEVTFVLNGRKDALKETACAQLWFAKPIAKSNNTPLSSLMRSSTKATDATSSSSSSNVSSSTAKSFVHQSPIKPMLVLFTQGKDKDKLSIVTIDIGSGAAVNTERCDCRYSGSVGLCCRDTAIENRKGATYLDAQRYESSANGDIGWNLAHLAQTNSPSSSKKWEGLKRVTLRFPTTEARARFAGTPNQCRCRTLKQGELAHCLKSGHRGRWGEMLEYHRQQMNGYHQIRYRGQQQLIHRPSW